MGFACVYLVNVAFSVLLVKVIVWRGGHELEIYDHWYECCYIVDAWSMAMVIGLNPNWNQIEMNCNGINLVKTVFKGIRQPTNFGQNKKFTLNYCMMSYCCSFVFRVFVSFHDRDRVIWIASMDHSIHRRVQLVQLFEQ